MEYNRLSGILLHPTCFEGTNGIGTIGKKAYDFVDWLKRLINHYGKFYHLVQQVMEILLMLHLVLLLEIHY